MNFGNLKKLTPVKGTSLIITFTSCKEQTGDVQLDLSFHFLSSCNSYIYYHSALGHSFVCQPLTLLEGFYFISNRLLI